MVTVLNSFNTFFPLISSRVKSVFLTIALDKGKNSDSRSVCRNNSLGIPIHPPRGECCILPPSFCYCIFVLTSYLFCSSGYQEQLQHQSSQSYNGVSTREDPLVVGQACVSAMFQLKAPTLSHFKYLNNAKYNLTQGVSQLAIYSIHALVVDSPKCNFLKDSC